MDFSFGAFSPQIPTLFLKWPISPKYAHGFILLCFDKVSSLHAADCGLVTDIPYVRWHWGNRAETFRQLTALPKCTSISTKSCLRILGCIIYKTIYSLRQSLPPIPQTATLNTGTTHLLSLWSLFEICNLLCQWTKNTGAYVYETENNFHRLDFTVHFTLSFWLWLSFYKTKKYLN